MPDIDETPPAAGPAGPVVRVYAVVNLRTGRIHGITCNINQSSAWVRELNDRYGDPLAAVQGVDLVDPAEQEIPWTAPATAEGSARCADGQGGDLRNA